MMLSARRRALLLRGRRRPLDPLRLLLSLTRSLCSRTHLRLQNLALDAGQFRGVTKLSTRLPRRAGALQRLTHRRLPLRVRMKDDRAPRDVVADGGRKTDAAKGAEVVASAGQVGAHLGRSEPAFADAAQRNLMVPTHADQTAPFVWRQWVHR